MPYVINKTKSGISATQFQIKEKPPNEAIATDAARECAESSRCIAFNSTGKSVCGGCTLHRLSALLGRQEKTMELVIHIKCSSDEAHQKIEDVCKDSNDLFIDEKNSWDSWVAERRPNFVNAPDSLKPAILEGIAYSMEYVDAETVVFTRCR